LFPQQTVDQPTHSWSAPVLACVCRYVAAYEAETLAFIDSIEAGSKADAPITGEDGVVALAMAIAAGKSAEERRWVKMSEVLPSITTKVPPRDRLGSFLRSLGSLRRDVAPQKA